MSITFEAGEMAHMPGSTLSFGALVRQYNFVAGTASWFKRLSVVAATVKPAVSPEVDEIDEQLPTNAAYKAARMPKCRGSRATGAYRDLTLADGPTTFTTTASMGSISL